MSSGVVLQDPALGPIFGETTAEKTLLWVRGGEERRAAVRWRARGSQPWGEPESFPLHPDLDHIGVHDLLFRGASEIEVEVGTVPAGVPATAALDFTKLSDAARGRCKA